MKTSQVSASLNDTKDTSGGPKVSRGGHPKVRPGLNLLTEKDQVGSKTNRTENQPQSPAQISPGGKINQLYFTLHAIVCYLNGIMIIRL